MATENEDHDPHFEPIISLPEQVVPTLEEDEDVLFKMRAKLFRWANESDPAEWKERGTGDIKFLKHKKTSRIRLLMRRDKTFKTCANHYLDKHMELVPNCGSDRAWVWKAFADFADEEPKEELLAIKFLNAENANKFKDNFDKYKEENADLNLSGKTSEKEEKAPDNGESDEVAEKLQELTVTEKNDSGDESEEMKKTDRIESKSPAKNDSDEVNLSEDAPEK